MSIIMRGIRSQKQGEMGYKSKIAVPGTRPRRQNPLQGPEMPQEGTYEGRGDKWGPCRPGAGLRRP